MKIYNCEECGFSTKYKNRIKYHINVRRKCGIENINFKRECDDNNEQDKSNKYSEIIDTINTRQSELDEQEQELKNKTDALNMRENEINSKFEIIRSKLNAINNNKTNEYALALSKEQIRNTPRGFTFI